MVASLKAHTLFCGVVTPCYKHNDKVPQLHTTKKYESLRLLISMHINVQTEWCNSANSVVVVIVLQVWLGYSKS